jgi:diaminohydroxyphosphoribosylaminopyrimidine deaminase/5-amino-6-(5-phosphoribosylamino)uracil reductase
VAVVDRDENGVSLPALVEFLGKRDIQGVLLEGGPTLAWSAIRDGIVDQVVLYLSCALIGGRDAPGWLGGAGAPTLAEASQLDIVSVEWLDRDLKVVADVHRDR